ncbi:MAG: LysE family translocator [Magnetovibrio sp.]|nr:LysE family translocator [Magnetovibrio sp.]
MSAEYLLTSLIVVLMPGTGVIYTLSQGISGGARASAAATFGCTLGIVPHMAASILGLAALLHASALAFQMVKFAGVAYLFYLAWMTLKDNGALDITGKSSPKGYAKIALQGFLINILNPKLSIFFLAFLPQFVPHIDQASRPTVVIEMVILSAIFMAITAVVFALYGLMAASMREHVLARPGVMKGMRRVFAGAFGALGLKLALAER